jgi:hypothetical protein
MKRSWIWVLGLVMFCFCAWLSAGCAASGGKTRPQATDNEVLRGIKEVHMSFSHDFTSAADAERCDVLNEMLERVAHAKFTSLGISIAGTDKIEKQSLLSTCIFLDKNASTVSFVVEYSVFADGKGRKIFRESCDQWNRTDYTPGRHEKQRLIEEAADSLMTDYNRVLDELLRYVLNARAESQ